ncbi:protein of unknown function [Cyanobium sp. NIES-981]|nr:protein of unknown function [Cyanobium sp. NIES-981]
MQGPLKLEARQSSIIFMPTSTSFHKLGYCILSYQ